jgi:hypothetical protein
LPTAEFAYNNNTHTSLGVLPFRANYGFDPVFGGVPVADQCIPLVEKRLKQIEEVQSELKEFLAGAQEAMKTQFDRKVRQTLDWQIGNKVWLDSQNVPNTRPSPKLGHQWLGPFPITAKISRSAYRLTLPSSMRGIHPVFHMSVLRKCTTDAIAGRRGKRSEPVEVDGKWEWEVEEILNCRRRGKKMEFLVSWKGFGPEENSWEPQAHLTNCAEAVQEFNTKYPDAAARHKRRRRMA